jgi:lysozyme family protein
MNKIILPVLNKIVRLTFIPVLFLGSITIKADSSFHHTMSKLRGTTHSHSSRSASDNEQAETINSSAGKVGFNRAIPFTLRHEGGLVDDKADKGGITKYGISLVYLRDLLAHNSQLLPEFSLSHASQVNPSVIRNMTKRQAIQIYYDQWWKKYHYGSIKKPSIATKVFDYSVNMGAKPAIKLLKIACRNEAGFPCVAINGNLDNKSVQYINSLNSAQTKQLLFTFNEVVSDHYRDIAERHPASKKFLLGWLKRANDNKGLVV